jgi:hypothetical protein
MAIQRKVPAKRNSLAITWGGCDYPRIPPGIYSAVVNCVQGPQWVRCYRRWSLRIAFSILGEDGDVVVSAFFNLGKNPDKCEFGARSRYFSCWVKANGGLPKHGQTMMPDVFFEGQVFEVVVADATLNTQNERKAEAEIYSKVLDIRKVTFAKTESINH